MNRIDKKFQELNGEKALITFVTAGDPDLDTTKKLVLEMEKSGADLIEIGVPFSDPIAEGPTIQKASLRALKGGVTLVKIFDTVRELRQETDAPLLLMMYVNTIFRFGTERFFSLCKETGIDGVIVPDLPYEEKDELSDMALKYGVKQISLVAPTSHDRIAEIAGNAEGFLYCVSSTGVTGTRTEFKTNFDEFFGEIKKSVKIPYCVGFGISSPEQAKKMSEYCDGVIVGSGVVKIVEQYGKDSIGPVGEFVSALKKGMKA
ncbi:MAG: tryptophan synthase subunit alpha [Oscillospiraceae bacterium]|nr:tryptophan synthase subunit alpha [Oscillospiraceae bacterium]